MLSFIALLITMTVFPFHAVTTSILNLCSTENSTEMSYFAKNQTSQACGCERCLKRCCKPGYIYKQQYCHRGSTDMLNVTIYTEKTSFVQNLHNVEHFQVGVPACPGMFRVNSSVDKFYIQTDYSVWVPKYQKFYSAERYCVDEYGGATLFLCFASKVVEKSTVTSIGMLISMPFLLLTFLVYVILPDSSIHKRALMFYVLSLFLAYMCLVIVQLHTTNTSPIPNVPCNILGYSIIFFFIVSFCWLNVMCIDMWLAFSGLTRFVGSRKAETRRFLYYCVYALGTPLILILIVYIMNKSANENSIFHPKLGIGRCFLEDGYPNLFYFYLPMAILIAINITLFVLTAVKIQQVKKETSMLKQNDSKRHTYEDDKQKFNLYLKLMLAMGVNWSMEVISWLINWQTKSFPTAVWYLTDFANAAYGVFIFFIFVFKKKIWVQLQKRYYIWIGKPHLAQALSTTTTRTSGFSTADSHLHQSEIRLSNIRNGNREERPLRAN